ncbi:MAG: thioredoxin [Bacteroides sp.]|nr:thioredoxin [Bacillota bacterium]MCM1393426.1 thioredoxin [[Eubacterium] siraeum]MCM1455173.1 thioredoxin [Bacteroides sp.]
MELILTSDNFDATVSHGVSLVDFWATWCGPCKMLAPTVEELAQEYAGKAQICKVDVDEYPKLAEKFAIYSIPTMLIFKDGELVDRMTGFRAKSQITEILDKYI